MLRRVLMTVDAVGGVWRYAIDLTRALQPHKVDFLLLGAGPPPDASAQRECAAVTNIELQWTDMPLDWTVQREQELAGVSTTLEQWAHAWQPDILHLNLPSQAVGLSAELPVVVMSHSCLPTWWDSMRENELPPDWNWHVERNRRGFRRAHSVIAPSISHGEAMQRIYGPLPHLSVVYNATTMTQQQLGAKRAFVLAVGRWWDEAKNAALLDTAAGMAAWPIRMVGPFVGPNGQSYTARNADFCGAVSAEATRQAMASAAIFAAPSRYEPFGLAVLEAATCGAALLLADIPTFRELWQGAARFVPVDDPGAWAAAIDALAEDSMLREELGTLAMARASQYSSRLQAARMHSVYARAVTRPKAAALSVA